jgi:hypothetical protein
VWKDVRYAAAPVGALRFAKAAPPVHNATLQTGTGGVSCETGMGVSGFVGSLAGRLTGMREGLSALALFGLGILSFWI